MISKFTKIFKYLLILPLFMGVFTYANQAQAIDWGGILGGNTDQYTSGSGLGGLWGNANSYDYNSTSEQHTGDIRLKKQVRRVTQDQDYHETTTLRSGGEVEIRLEVRNTSNTAAIVTVTDQLGGSVVYKKDSLRLNGQPAAAGLTSSGMRLNMAGKSTGVITYNIYVCSGSNSVIRANAYAPGIGSATDGVIIQTPDTQFTNSYSGNDVAVCLNQFQNNSAGQYGSAPSTTSAGNPFGDWTGVNNASSTTTQTNNPFAGWTGVNNSNAASSTVNNPFGDWAGMNNSNPSTTQTNNPFGDWYGANSNSAQSNPFGDWAGVNSTSGYDMRGYTNNTVAYNSSSINSALNSSAGTRSVSYSDATPTTTTTYVAPTTGVNKFAPLLFAGFITAAFLIYKKRTLIFS